jgi:hypothetical protein
MPTDTSGYGIASPVTPPTFSTAASTLPSTLTQIGQAGFSDAYKILQLLNPVPPGTTLQTGPGGTFITRAAAGQPTPSALTSPLGAASGGGLLWLVGIGFVIFVLARNK